MMPEVTAKPKPPQPQVSDGKITKRQKYKIHAFNEVQKHLGFRFSEDFEGKNGKEIAEIMTAAIAARESSQSESKIVMMEAFDVQFGGVTHTIGRLPMKAEAGIRKKMQALVGKTMTFVSKQGINLEKIDDLDAIKTFVPFLLNEAWDTLIEIFWDYAEATDGIDRKEQEEVVLFDEMMHAITCLLEVVIPFFVHQARRMMGAAKGISLASAA